LIHYFSPFYILGFSMFANVKYALHFVKFILHFLANFLLELIDKIPDFFVTSLSVIG